MRAPRRTAGERVLLGGISYDDEDDVVVIGLDTPGGLPEEVEHFVSNPQRVMVTGLDDGSTVIEVEDAEGHQTLLRCAEVPALPPEQSMTRARERVAVRRFVRRRRHGAIYSCNVANWPP